jgi:hypothetical protein
MTLPGDGRNYGPKHVNKVLSRVLVILDADLAR